MPLNKLERHKGYAMTQPGHDGEALAHQQRLLGSLAATVVRDGWALSYA